MLSNNISICKWHVGHLSSWKPGINDCRIPSSWLDRGDVFMEVTLPGFRGLPSPELALTNRVITKDWAHTARWHKSHPTKDTPAEGAGKKPHILTDPASEEEACRIGAFLQPRKDMTGFKFPAKRNKDSPLPSTQWQTFPFAYLCLSTELWPAEQWVLKGPHCLQSHPPALWWVTLSSEMLLSQVTDWISATSKPLNLNIWCLEPVLPCKEW